MNSVFKGGKLIQDMVAVLSSGSGSGRNGTTAEGFARPKPVLVVGITDQVLMGSTLKTIGRLKDKVIIVYVN